MPNESAKRWLSWSLIFLAVTAVYLYGYPAPTITYAAMDLLHVAVGVVLTILLAVFLFPLLQVQANLYRIGLLLLTSGALLGVILIKIGTPLRLKTWLFAHIALCVVGTLLLAAAWLHSNGWLGRNALSSALRFAALALLTKTIALGAW